MLASGQLRAGYQVRVLACLEQGTPEPEFLANLRAEQVDVRVIRYRARAYISLARAIVFERRAYRPDILHSHGYVADVLVALTTSRRRGHSTLSTVHGFTGGSLRNRIYEALQTWAYRRIGVVVAVSAKLARDLQDRGVSTTKIMVIANAFIAPRVAPMSRVEARRQCGIAPWVFAIGWIGRISVEKGPDVLVRALALLEQYPFVAVVIGDGAQRQDVMALATRLGIAGSIQWKGPVSAAWQLLPAFDVMVISSRTEGLPITLLEAMYFGIPVVATSVGGIPEVLGMSEAILVPSERPELMAAAILDVHRNPDAAGRRAALARNRLDVEFGGDQWVRAYSAAYEAADRTAHRGDTLKAPPHTGAAN